MHSAIYSSYGQYMVVNECFSVRLSVLVQSELTLVFMEFGQLQSARDHEA